MDDNARRARFGRAVRAERQHLALNQTDFAANVGLSQTIVSRWELGQVEPEPMQVFGLEMALGLPPGTLSRYLGYLPVDPSDAPEPRTITETGSASLAALPTTLRVVGAERLAETMRNIQIIPAEQLAAMQAMADQLTEALRPLTVFAESVRAATQVHAPTVRIDDDAVRRHAEIARDTITSVDTLAGKAKRKKKVSQPEDGDGDE